ncbi:MAG: alkane 1-monooxygenase [Cypionkella sp.]|nr:alkane 1-monooxygenase [Cypionkella sp.]
MQRALPLWLFSLAALMPPSLLIAGMVWGGVAAWAGLLAITAFAAVMDRFSALFMGNAPEGAEFPGADTLLALLALLHLTLLPLIVAHLAGAAALSDKIGLFLGASLWLGQISNPAAHELIHRAPRALFWAGAGMFSAVLFGHHTSAHRLVHHTHAATPLDPNTARSGEGFYRFFLRAWAGSFTRGYKAENDLRARRSGAQGLHPYAIYIGTSALCLALAYILGGALGAMIWAGLALSAQAQLMLSDYVQHYGLSRHMGPNGKYEPVQDRHSWNAPQWYSSAMMVNAPRHSDHHAHPARAYPALRLPSETDAPRLPWPLPLACTIALFPPVWKRAIRPHLKPWLLPPSSAQQI